MIPTNIRYTKTHEWVKIENMNAIFGLTEHAVKEIRDVVFMDLKPIGTVLKQGDPLGCIESVKAVFDIYCPMSGVVTAINSIVVEKPNIVSTDPYGAGWLTMVQLKDSNELEQLMDAETYTEYIDKKGSGH